MANGPLHISSHLGRSGHGIVDSTRHRQALTFNGQPDVTVPASMFA